jgi:hypothetical protein
VASKTRRQATSAEIELREKSAEVQRLHEQLRAAIEKRDVCKHV